MLRNRKDAVQTSFWLPIVIVVIHIMVSENIELSSFFVFIFCVYT